MRSITSNSLLMMERSREFLWAKQAAHLDNIANAETPGYKVKTVSFEEIFGQKIKMAAKTSRGSASGVRNVIEKAEWTVNEDQETTRMDDNGVNVTEQSVEAVRTGYQLQYVYQAISNDLSILKKAIGG